jgi:hypothetical protein
MALTRIPNRLFLSFMGFYDVASNQGKANIARNVFVTHFVSSIVEFSGIL